MPLRDLETVITDVLVVGHGATGLFAARELAKNGNAVAVVGTGTPTGELSTGCISFPETGSWWVGHGLDDALLAESYALVDAKVQEILGSGHCTWMGSSARKVSLVTNIGTVIRTNYAPVTSQRYEMDALRGMKLAMLGVRDDKDLDPVLACAMLRSEMGIDAEPVWSPPVQEGPGRGAIQFGHGVKRSIEDLVEQLTSIDADLVLMPPLTHELGHDAAWEQLGRHSGRPLGEVVTPLSMPGRFLIDSFALAAFKAGALDLRGMRLSDIDVRDDPALAICASGLRRQPIRAKAVLFCGGNVVSGGLDLKGTEVFDPLSFFDVRQGPAWAGPLMRASGSGVASDPLLRAFSQGERQDRVLVAGSALPGMNFANGLGLGACLTTALAACRTIEEVL